ncbi:GNAT family N-acetyltransferase [Marinicella meishanensis]|uniref:GNAT family N-acetyltransferase n=1 Tax=Marinicella meishanensis TaxID=2873263 RepID=UPI001CBCBB07|nr:N-acetyltransferase [Marinicella sp. NBU2979]
MNDQSAKTAQTQSVQIRPATDADWPGIWSFFHAIVAAGETYGFDRDLTSEQGRRLWMDTPRATFVVTLADTILGTYFIKSNQAGPGSHVCNCGYMVSAQARGQGLATLLCEHSKQTAIELGYLAMQFNFVATSNEGAVRLWHKLGFETVGRLPRAFEHPAQGLVDALVMYQWLGPASR